jgi:two-component system, NarL family, nitrate/nitrite sensor histidine kinase NarX
VFKRRFLFRTKKLDLLKRIQESIVIRLAALMVALVTITFVGVLSSYFIAGQSERHAEAVNAADSLRMQSLHILVDVIALDRESTAQSTSPENLAQSALVVQALNEFEQRLVDPVLQSVADEEIGSRIQTHYQQIQQQWYANVRPVLEGHIEGFATQTNEVLSVLVVEFVREFDELVKMYQKQVEDWVANIRFVQALTLFSVVALVTIALLILHYHVKLPLQWLIEAARKIGRGEFSEKVVIHNQDELGLLANAINQMSSDLARMYSTLEMRIDEKTKALTATVDALNLFYHVAREVSEKNQESMDFQSWLKNLADLTHTQSIDLCLKMPEAEAPYEHIRSDYFQPLAQQCNLELCADCMVSETQVCRQNGSTQIRFPLLKEAVHYGVLVVHPMSGNMLSGWQQKAFQSFADQVAVSLSLRNQASQQRRAALMDERNVITKELHDSLGQSLNHLKIQIARLNRHLGRENFKNEILSEITLELREGITAACCRLRELLSTFRISVAEKSFEAAVSHIVARLRKQYPAIHIEFDYNIRDISFTAREEIHLLQLTREAILNAIRHSFGIEVDVIFSSSAEKKVMVQILDNGIGIPREFENISHFGLASMQERSRNLGGVLNFFRRATGGTEVRFVFLPDYAGLSGESSAFSC